MDLPTDYQCKNISVTINFSLNAIRDPALKLITNYKIPFIKPSSRTVNDVNQIIADVIYNKHPPGEIDTILQDLLLIK